MKIVAAATVLFLVVTSALAASGGEGDACSSARNSALWNAPMWATQTRSFGKRASNRANRSTPVKGSR